MENAAERWKNEEEKRGGKRTERASIRTASDRENERKERRQQSKETERYEKREVVKS